MLKRQPVTIDGKVVDRLQESGRVYKPFKPPTLAKPQREQPQRKRKRVSYKGADGSDDDSEKENSKKKKKGDQDYGLEGLDLTAHDLKRFPVFEVKSFESLGSRRFSIPCMKNKKGEVVPTTPTNISLGIRPQAVLLPRPLHDPFEDHAIVLYDPTIDDRETEEEKLEREKEEAREKAMKEAEERNRGLGLINPHKSLRKLLNEEKKPMKTQKVPVVLCPKLTKVLRPHQIEGVKVRYRPLVLAISHLMTHSSCTNARLG
jgi:DNA repair and recombination RAD54-like protein